MNILLTLRAGALVASIPALIGQSCSEAPDSMALGVLAQDRVALTATASEIVVAEPVAEGTPVKKGTVLVQLADKLQAANVASAQANRDKAQADLDKLTQGARPEELAIAEARVESARASFKEADSSLERSRALRDKGTITTATFDQEQARHDSAKAELASAEQSLAELTSGAREEDLRIAQAALAAAQAQLDGAKAKLADLTIRASRDGVLDSLPWNVGERVTTGSPVAVMLAGATPYARVYVPEPYRVHLKQGDKLPVHVDGVDKPFDGILRWISNDPAFTPYYALNQKERSRLVYLAEIDLPQEAAGLPVGIPVEVSLP